ncbi:MULTISPECIES: ComEA family DNA-binding protein [Acinetobacter]|jgi:competence protein ComEA|uniref:Competence protein ComE n=1 Tax=Acinetobacter chengduensis TaxID=2420890 RepID=A0ABX9TZS3_9GAMM|nr:helix-hairpin-helix domain-containing protein [Acinetobacter sp. FL51]RKG42952.1 competence protein ComE [Acinetobacter sp. WCHAc060007]RLL24448.1 competence protein ComE [Acinetobacter chengduensis]
MKQGGLSKAQLLLWLMILMTLSISWAKAETAQYTQWKATQQAHDQRLKTSDTEAKHYLSKPTLNANTLGTKVNLNTANIEQLQQLHGIGQKKAEAIVDYRSKNGKFKTIEEIQQVKGIGPALYSKNRPRLSL